MQRFKPIHWENQFTRLFSISVLNVPIASIFQRYPHSQPSFNQTHSQIQSSCLTFHLQRYNGFLNKQYFKC